RLLGKVPRVGEHGELVAGQRRVGEDVADDVPKCRHLPSLFSPSRPRLGRFIGSRGAPGTARDTPEERESLAEPLRVEAPTADLAHALMQRLHAFPTELAE